MNTSKHTQRIQTMFETIAAIIDIDVRVLAIILAAPVTAVVTSILYRWV